MDRLKRILCLFLALVFLLTAPGVVPVKTEANPAVAVLTCSLWACCSLPGPVFLLNNLTRPSR